MEKGYDVRFCLKQNETDWIKEFSNKYDISPNLVLFILLVEDKRFLRHRGVDWIGLIRAIIHNIKNLGLREGASTITQQLLVISGKSNRNKKIINKVNKIIKAINTEKKVSKEELLTKYLEKVYFGRSYYGIYSAAENYFGTSVSNLNKAESFFLAERIALPNIFRKDRVIRMLNRPEIKKMFSKKDLKELQRIYCEVFNIDVEILKEVGLNERFIQNPERSSSDPTSIS